MVWGLYEDGSLPHQVSVNSAKADDPGPGADMHFPGELVSCSCCKKVLQTGWP